MIKPARADGGVHLRGIPYKFLFPCQAAYLLRREEGERLEDFLSNRVFAGVSGSTAAPDGAEAAAFGAYIQRYKALLQVERAAAELL